MNFLVKNANEWSKKQQQCRVVEGKDCQNIKCLLTDMFAYMESLQQLGTASKDLYLISLAV